MKTLKNKRIGVLGGIGPESTIEFYALLIRKLQEKSLIKSNTDFPQIIINSIPVPELFGVNSPKANLKSYINGIKELDEHSPDIIVIVCNSAYAFYNTFQKEIKSPILNLTTKVKEALQKFDSFVVLGTSTTIREGVYNFKGLKQIRLEEEDIKVLDKAIFDFNKGFKKEKQKNLVKRIAKKYLKRKSDVVLLGCTEIALMLKNSNIPKINTIDLLAESTINFFRGKRK